MRASEQFPMARGMVRVTNARRVVAIIMGGTNARLKGAADPTMAKERKRWASMFVCLFVCLRGGLSVLLFYGIGDLPPEIFLE